MLESVAGRLLPVYEGTMLPGALLIHGFTATPECLDSLSQPLRAKGFLVEAPLLAGHGTTAQDLSRTKWQDWYGSVTEAFERLRKKTDRISVAGLSLGGILALLLATEFPIKRLALLATPVIFKGFVTTRILPLIGNTFLKEIYRYQPKWTGSSINDPEGRSQFKNYTKMPIASIMQIVRLQQCVRSKLSSVTVPTLILHSPQDTTAPFQNVAYLEENLGSKRIKTVILERSNHVLTLDYDKEIVAEEVVKFFEGTRKGRC